MKTFVFDNNYGHSPATGTPSWYFLADSSLTNAGKPFFIPEFAEEFDAIPTMAVKINRLGKSIASKFSQRYYSEFAPAVHFRATGLKHRLESMHLSADKACSFDRSFIMAAYMPLPFSGDVEISMKKNGEIASHFHTSELSVTIDETISMASDSNTLKIGDIIVPGLPQPTRIQIGDLIELNVDGTSILTVQIK